MNSPYGASAPDDFASALNNGDDTILGTNAAETIDGGKGDDVIDGSGGADVMLGGAGADTLIWNPGGGNDTVDGGAGRDTLAFNGANINEVILLQSDVGSHAVLTRNVANIVMDVDNIERVAFRALGGADTFAIGDLTQTDIRQVDIDLGATGGGGDGAADVVGVGGDSTADRIVLTNKAGIVNVTGVGVGLTIANGEAADRLAASTGSGDDRLDISHLDGGIGVNFNGGEGLDTLVMDGTAGADTISVLSLAGQNGLPDTVDFTINGVNSHADLTGVEILSVDAGDGDDDVNGRIVQGAAKLDVDGGRGNDTLTGSFGTDTLNGGAGDDRIDGGGQGDLMLGGAGNDTLLWNPGGGSDTVDGGTGQDELQFNGSNIGEKLSLTAGADGHAVLTRDVAAITMDVDNTERVAFRALGGADRVTIGDLRATDIRQVDVNLAGTDGAGDAAADVVAAGGSELADRIVLTNTAGTVSVTGVGVGLAITGADADDRFAADLGAGDDKVDISHLDGGIGLAFNGGEGLDTLVMDGTAGADTISVLSLAGQNGLPDTVDFTINGVNSHGDLTGVEILSVDAGDGDDDVNGRIVQGAARLDVDGGRGNDTLIGSFSTDTLNGGAGDDRIDGGGQADLMLGGAGDDSLIWNPGGGSDTVDGGSGQDTLFFNGSNIGEKISLTAGADGHAVLTRDVAAITMDVDNVERVSFAALGGADNIAIGDLAGTGIRQVDVNLQALGTPGDGAADTVAVSGRAVADRFVFTERAGVVTVDGLNFDLNITGGEPADRVAVAAGGGNDTFDISHLNGGIGIDVDGGEGRDTLIANGTAAGDQIEVLSLRGQNGAPDDFGFSLNGAATGGNTRGLEVISVDAGDGDDNVNGRLVAADSTFVVDGGKGNDTLTGGSGADTLNGGVGDDRIDGGGGADLMRGETGDDTLVWNPGGGSDTVDGGAGQDELQFNGSNIGENISLTAGVGGHAVLTRDVAAINMDVNNVEHVSFRALSGADHFTFGNLRTTDIRQVDVNLAATDGAGDGAADTISFTAGKQTGHLDVQIAGFENHAAHPAGDVLILNGFADHSFADAVAAHHIFETGTGVTIADGTGLVVTLQNTTLAGLGASDFLFG